MAAEKLSAKDKKFRQSIWQEIPQLLIRLVQSHICRADATVHGGQCLAYFIGESTAIDNQAHSGLTTENLSQ